MIDEKAAFEGPSNSAASDVLKDLYGEVDLNKKSKFLFHAAAWRFKNASTR